MEGWSMGKPRMTMLEAFAALRAKAEAESGYLPPLDPAVAVIGPSMYRWCLGQGYIETDGTLTPSGIEALWQGIKLRLQQANDEAGRNDAT